MPSKEHLRALRLQIGNNRTTSTLRTSKRYFLAPPLLTAILTPPAVTQAVAELNCPPEDRIDLVETIVRHGRIIFAILVWMQCEDAIVDFRRAGCLDSRLPLDESTAMRITPHRGREFAAEYQWQFLPHFFHCNDDLQINSSVILPFISEIGTEEGGSFGFITKVEIHPLLQDFSPRQDRPLLVVRKTLRPKGSSEHRMMLFKNEKRSLRLLNCLKHPNIIPLFGAYSHGEDLNFLFPLIDTDLAAFFERGSRHGDFRWNFTFFSAMHGLASALSNAHNVRLRASTEGLDFSGIGYHHDLRPANVLVSKETFILADFGMGNLKPADKGSQTQWKAGAGDYLAPECMDNNFVHQDVGRAIDVWAFGCLIAEVATFMRIGNEGLRRFCEARLGPGYFSNWETSYFHDYQGNLKGSVKQWLGFLTSGNDLPALNQPLYRLIVDILTPVTKRPTIADVTLRLAVLSIKAHFFSVLECLTEVIEAKSFEDPVAPASMKMWFERERLKAFGQVLCLHEFDWNVSVLQVIEHEYANYVRIMVQLFKMFQPSQVAIESSTGVANESNTQTYYYDNLAALPETRMAELSVNQDTEVQRLVQKLWDILPKAQLEKVENVWVNSMLETDDIERLTNLGQALSLEHSNGYQEGAAMAMMRKIRLEMIHNPTSSAELKGLEISPNDVIECKEFDGHKLGALMKTTIVIIEWMHYDDSWENIPSSERTTVMALKAKGFNVEHKPELFRLLHCIGFVEQAVGRVGYGFVYQVPQKEPCTDPAATKATTLLRLLLLSAKEARREQYLNQPLLGDKYRLAYILAASLMEFHSIGWLHENFHSNNIVFFNEPPDGHTISPASSSIINEPYIVGLHKSRPGGNAWHTQGPTQDADFLNYQHPAYAKTRHFRNSYDYYSFGLVLLEIGLWTPLKAWSMKPKHRTMSPDSFRDALIRTYVPRLGPRMGEVYRDVVRLLLMDGLCPSPGSKEPDPTLERNAFQKYFDEVVDPLAALSGANL